MRQMQQTHGRGERDTGRNDARRSMHSSPSALAHLFLCVCCCGPLSACCAGDVDEDALSVESQTLYLTRQVEALKLTLVKADNKSTLAEVVVRELRSKLNDLQKDYEEEKVTLTHNKHAHESECNPAAAKWSFYCSRRRCACTPRPAHILSCRDPPPFTYALASDMTRQYKRKVEDMLREKSEEEQLRLAVEDKLAAVQLSKEQMERDLMQRLQLKEAEIAEQKAKMDEMAHEFGLMLKSTLDKMSEKIEISSDWASEAKDEPIVRTFEDFNLGLNR